MILYYMVENEEVTENYAREEIYSELDAICKMYRVSPKTAYEQFIDDFYDCYHVIDYKLNFAKQWLEEKLEDEIT